MVDFYGDPATWDKDFYGDYPTTTDQKVEFGVATYSGDSGVSQEELEAYLKDLTETAAREATVPQW